MVGSILDCSACWDLIPVGLALVCSSDDCSTRGWGSSVGVVVGRRL
jgi:hypothetical protein